MISRPYLEIEFGPDQGKEICITDDSMIIGRDSSCAISIPNGKISRVHARIFLHESRWMIEDLESTNHTRVDKVKLVPYEKKMLTNGDRIQLASQVILCFHDPDSTLAEDSRVLTDELLLDVGRGDVYIHNKVLKPRLSRRSFSILKLLYEKSLTPCPIANLEEIATAGWPGEDGITDQMIDTQIYRLRQRLAEHVPDHDFIQSERSRGRRFVQLAKKQV